MDINVEHAVANACVFLEHNLIPLWSGDYPVALGVVNNFISVFFKSEEWREG